MQQPGIRFKLGGGYWVPERRSVGFTGTTERGGRVPHHHRQRAQGNAGSLTGRHRQRIGAGDIHRFEAVIHRIARLEFVKQRGGEAPILLAAVDVELH